MTEQRIITRRVALSIGGASVTAAALAACAPGTPDSAPTTAPSATDPSPSGAPSATGGAVPPADQTGGSEVAKLSDIPVGGSIDAKLGSAPILLAQPEAGTVVGFSAICTHQGCVVAAAGAELDCPCHNSRFDAATGAVLSGPALEPLIKIDVSVSGDSVLANG